VVRSNSFNFEAAAASLADAVQAQQAQPDHDDDVASASAAPSVSCLATLACDAQGLREVLGLGVGGGWGVGWCGV